VPTQQAWRSKRKFYKVEKINGEFLTNGNGNDSKAVKLVSVNELKLLDITAPVRKVIQQAYDLFSSCDKLDHIEKA
jgi:hypothetical protein